MTGIEIMKYVFRRLRILKKIQIQIDDQIFCSNFTEDFMFKKERTEKKYMQFLLATYELG